MKKQLPLIILVLALFGMLFYIADSIKEENSDKITVSNINDNDPSVEDKGLDLTSKETCFQKDSEEEIKSCLDKLTLKEKVVKEARKDSLNFIYEEDGTKIKILSEIKNNYYYFPRQEKFDYERCVQNFSLYNRNEFEINVFIDKFEDKEKENQEITVYPILICRTMSENPIEIKIIQYYHEFSDDREREELLESFSK